MEKMGTDDFIIDKLRLTKHSNSLWEKPWTCMYTKRHRKLNLSRTRFNVFFKTIGSRIMYPKYLWALIITNLSCQLVNRDEQDLSTFRHQQINHIHIVRYFILFISLPNSKYVKALGKSNACIWRCLINLLREVARFFYYQRIFMFDV